MLISLVSDTQLNSFSLHWPPLSEAGIWAAIISSLTTVGLFALNRRTINDSRKQFNRQFMGKPYETIVHLITDTLEPMLKWSRDLEDRKVPDVDEFQGLRLDVAEVLKQKENSKSLPIQLSLYPHDDINRLVYAWMERLLKVLSSLDQLKEQEVFDQYGASWNAFSRDSDLLDDITEQLHELELGINSITTKMAEVLKV